MFSKYHLVLRFAMEESSFRFKQNKILKYNEDGSFNVYIQKNNHGKDKETNWLPAPDGPFYMLMRLYWPEDAFLKGTWKSPAVIKTK